MSRVVPAGAFATGLLLAACSPMSKVTTPAAVRPICTETSGEATMADPYAARAWARRSLQRSLGSARDFLAADGLRRLRVAAAQVDCTPYALAAGRGGLTRCVAVARICAK